MIIPYIKAVVIVSLSLLMASAASNLQENASSSLADQLHRSHIKDPVDGGWLPELTGLPDKDQVALLTQKMVDVVTSDQDPTCTAIDLNLRMMVFQHFVIYQQMVNAQNTYLDDDTAHQWAHVLAMVLKESSGDSSSITDMSGRSISTYESETNLQHWKEILDLTKQNRIQMNYQTNFGLTQLSSDRLFDAFRLLKDQQYDAAFLEGEEGAKTPGKRILNTAIAIRRLIWFYQDFAQGRIVEADKRIHQQDIDKPEFSARYQEGLNMALLYCGTRFMFRDEDLNGGAAKAAALQNAMASIAYCKLGNAQQGYGASSVDETCFAQWVTLCPALNIDIATLTPLGYFATRGQLPVCENVFKQLITHKPLI